MHDLVIRNGTIVDGTGAAKFVGDIAVDGGYITAVGQVGPEAAETIDAKGMIVFPGFVDVHTHFDAQVAWDTDLSFSSLHGVTTVVMGNCAVGLAPVLPDKQDDARMLLGGVEGLSFDALKEGVKFEWETFPEYLSFIKSKEFALDVGAMIPHGLVRTYVMGDRGWTQPATPEDIKRMAEIVRDGFNAGAVGFSTDRTGHRSTDGRNSPSRAALDEELLAIGRVMGDLGTGTLEVASSNPPKDDLDLAMRQQVWMRRFADQSHRPVSYVASQTYNNPTYWRDATRRGAYAAENGSTIRMQTQALPLINPESLILDTHGFKRTAFWREQMAGLDHAQQVEMMGDPKVRSTLIQEAKALRADTVGGFRFSHTYPMCKEGTDVPDWEPVAEVSVSGIAASEGRDEFEVYYDLLLQKDGTNMLMTDTQNYFDYNADVLREMLTNAYCDIASGDAGAHVTTNTGYSFPTRMITHWARDRWRGPKLPIEFLVKKQSRDTAALFGLNDRGALRPGFRADINIIDYDKLGVELPKLVFDMPGGSRRIMQESTGYKYTIVKGEVTLKDGKLTGAKPGRLVEGEQHVSNDYWQAVRHAVPVAID